MISRSQRHPDFENILATVTLDIADISRKTAAIARCSRCFLAAAVAKKARVSAANVILPAVFFRD
jgi:hypothetical protein